MLQSRSIVVPWCLSLALFAACSAEDRHRGGTPGVDGGAGYDGSSGWDAMSMPGRDGSVVDYDHACERIDVPTLPDVPNVLIVLDRSGSMYDPFSGIDRWTPSVAAINSVVSALESQVRFGLMIFPSDALECNAGNLVLAPALDQAASISGALRGSPETIVGGGTPTAPTLSAARDVLTPLEGQSYVLLVTDGAPNCNDTLDGSSCTCTGGLCLLNPYNCLDDVRTVRALEDLAAAGIGTYVIGYDTGEWSSVLNRMAVAGATGRTSAFEVTDGTSLEGALREISGSVVSCRYDLAMPPGDYHYVRVQIDDTDVPHTSVSGVDTGWENDGDRTVLLVGTPCDTLRDGREHHVTIVVECSPVII